MPPRIVLESLSCRKRLDLPEEARKRPIAEMLLIFGSLLLFSAITLCGTCWPECKANAATTEDDEEAPEPKGSLEDYIRALEVYYKHPMGLLNAVRHPTVEGGKNLVFYGRGSDGNDCVVGPWQILVKDCRTEAGRRSIWRLRDPVVNAAAAASELWTSRQKCKKHPKDCPCEYAHYNWDGRTEWCQKLMKVMPKPRGEI